MSDLPPSNQAVPLKGTSINLGGVVDGSGPHGPTPLPPPLPQAVVQFGMTQHRGPLPDAGTMAAYAAIDPGLPGRIMIMAEANAATERRTAERKQTFELISDLPGRVAGLVFAGISVGAAVYLTALGHDWVGGVLGGTTIAGVGLALIKGRAP